MTTKPVSEGRLPENQTPINDGKNGGDSTIPQTFADIRDKADRITINKDGTPRKKYTRKGAAADDRSHVVEGVAGFTEAQIKTAFQGLFNMAALATDCNVWFLSDSEADCFVPSATIALNQTFPSVAQSKWGAVTLASLSLSTVALAKLFLYAEYKRAQKAHEPEATPK